MRNNLIKGTAILTAAGIITRLLGFVYRIYVTKVMGAECIGLYQLIMPIYVLAWSISCAGFTTTISKLTAQELAKREHGNINRILKQSLVMTVAIGIVLNVLLYVFADSFSLTLFKDMRTMLSLKILAFSFPFMAAGSCIRGYFFGLQNSIVPAISQVVEQVIHMLIVYAFVGYASDLESMSALAVAGITFGEVISFLYVYIVYRMGKMKSRASMSNLKTFGLIMSLTLPLTANKVISSLLLTIENVLIPQRLQLCGMSFEKAISVYGQVTGMAMPLIFFPSVFLMSLSISLVPTVSQAHAIKDNRQINLATSKAILFTSVIGMCAGAFFIFFGNQIGSLVYGQDITQMLIVFGFMCPFLYLQITLSGILNGLGKQMFIFQNNLLTSIINVGFIYFLIPSKGIMAFILGWFISLIISCLMSLNVLTKQIDVKLQFDELILKPVLCAAATGFVMNLAAKKIIFHFANNLIGLFITAGGFGVIYILLIVMTGCVSKTEFEKLLPHCKS